MKSVTEVKFLTMLRQELHDFAQPVTGLQCRLEIGRMLGDRASLLETVDGALEDLGRITAAISRLRDLAVAAESER